MTQREIITKNLINGLKELDFKNVFEWLTRPISNKDLPSIVVEDGSDNIVEKNDSLEHNLNFTITIFTTDKSNAIKKVRDYMQETLNKIKELDKKLKLGQYVTVGKADIDVEQNNELVAIATIEISSKYHTARFEI